MPDYTLPFPGRELADQELTYDVCYAKILPQDRASIVERAWRKGEQAARDIFVKYSKNIMLNLGVLPFPYVYKSVYGKKEDETYAKIEGKGVSDSLSQ